MQRALKGLKLLGGTHFAVWAPSAQHIAVETEIGTFDLHRTQSAVWECDAPGVQAGMVYQYWVRGANGQSVGVTGLWPVGEGAGYAGGIMSAATDGIMAARKVVEALGGGVAE